MFIIPLIRGINQTKNGLNHITNVFQSILGVSPQQFEFWGEKKNNVAFLSMVHLTRGNYFGKKVIIARVVDITERKNTEVEMQKRLLQLDKMNKFMVDRKLKMVRLKQEIKELSVKPGQS